MNCVLFAVNQFWLQVCVCVCLWRSLFVSLSLSRCTRLLFSLSLLPQFRRTVTLRCLHPRTDKHYVTSLCKQKSSVDEQSPWSQVHIRAPTQTDAYIRNINAGGPEPKRGETWRSAPNTAASTAGCWLVILSRNNFISLSNVAINQPQTLRHNCCSDIKLTEQFQFSLDCIFLPAAVFLFHNAWPLKKTCPERFVLSSLPS